MKSLKIIAIIFLLFSCSGSDKNVESQVASENDNLDVAVLTDEQVKSLNITLGKIEKRALSNTIHVNGMLDVPPQNLISISAPLGGFVKDTKLLQGMKVRKGEVIVVMEHTDYIQIQQDYLESKNQLEFLDLEYTRQQQLSAENVNAAKTLQLAKSNFTSMKAKVEGLRSKLKLINLNPEEIERGNIRSSVSIVAPITGFVAQVNVNVGMFVNPTDVMFKLVDTDHLHAEAQVFEKDLTNLKIGQRTMIYLANETTSREATVYLIGKEITPERTVRVHCHFVKEDPDLIPGMYFNAIIETGENQVTAVPEKAIASFEGKSYVFTSSEKNKFEMVEITTGLSSAGYTEIILPTGFDQNKNIVTNGSYALLSTLKNSED